MVAISTQYQYNQTRNCTLNRLMKFIEDSKDKSHKSSLTSPAVDRLATGRDKLSKRQEQPCNINTVNACIQICFIHPWSVEGPGVSSNVSH